MSTTTDSSTYLESVDSGDEGSSVSVDSHRHCRCRLIPLEIANEGIFDNYNEGHSSTHVRPSTVSKEVDLENGELKVDNDGKQCRICHLTSDQCDDDENGDISEPMELGCNCKGDMAIAHQKCAVTWFMAKRNLHCEICGVMAHNILDVIENVPERAPNVNVAIEPIRSDEENLEDLEQALELSVSAIFNSEVESESSLSGRRFVNIILGSMVIAFFITWLFHFKIYLN